MFHYTKDVSMSVEETIPKLEEALKSEQFGVLWQFNIKDKLQEKGFEFEKEFVVLEVCNPEEAKRVLEEESLVSYFLPCKMVVYKEGDQTKVGMPKPTALMNMLENDKLEQLGADIEKRLIHCIDKLA
ncbi:DUF302 domain-containing protein [Metabacillus iocasae]|uniref:Uncharacterized protein (DUF302 family) n=1 Tax=Priestia iocasae TaxID=2291674 RepID=A0ABS2QWJ4_9BACI|nr:DUF302 domain-containing protein [Metabacillus iocasae]MBM7703578.1 uncharacterized protein (DUF302 family) [Metabacillus iocasae]